MLTLYSLTPAFGQPSGSGFSVKAMYLLNMAKADWTLEYTGDPRKFPHGKLPALKTPGGIVGDSDGIRAYLEAQGADFDTGLSPDDKANARAFIRMAEEHLYFHMLHDRWCDDRVWPLVRDTYFGDIPRPLRGIITSMIRKPVRQGLHQNGIGRMSEDTRMQRIECDLQAIAARLNTRPFLFGDLPTSADASVASMLAGGAASPVETALSQRIGSDPVLRPYFERVHAAVG